MSSLFIVYACSDRLAKGRLLKVCLYGFEAEVCCMKKCS
jgi:hypothetical protein